MKKVNTLKTMVGKNMPEIIQDIMDDEELDTMRKAVLISDANTALTMLKILLNKIGEK